MAGPRKNASLPYSPYPVVWYTEGSPVENTKSKTSLTSSFLFISIYSKTECPKISSVLRGNGALFADVILYSLSIVVTNDGVFSNNDLHFSSLVKRASRASFSEVISLIKDNEPLCPSILNGVELNAVNISVLSSLSIFTS